MSWEDQDAAFQGMLAGFQLPKPHSLRDEMALRRAGAKFGRDDDLLWRVMLPRGWTVHRSENKRYEGRLYDDQFRLRGTFYYYAGGLEPAKAWLTMECRYIITIYGENPSADHYVVWDRAEGIMRYDPETGDSDAPIALCEQWLDSHYRMWRYPYCYWPGMTPWWKFWRRQEL